MMFDSLTLIIKEKVRNQSSLNTCTEDQKNSNKRPMSHITHLKSMNTFERSYDYIYYKTDQVQEDKIFKFCQCIWII